MERKISERVIFKVKGKSLEGVSLPVLDPETCPKGIRQIINRQMYLPGREVILYLPDEGVLRRITADHFEEARQFTQHQRRRFIDKIMEDAQFADRITIQKSKN
jgi:hypothetical protein